jgi:hypothetical protein
MFASAASAKRRAELARDASLALSIPTTGNTQEANLTGYLSRKLEDKRRTAKKFKRRYHCYREHYT